MSDKLLPCPFCGSDKVIEAISLADLDYPQDKYVCCENCNNRTMMYSLMKDAIETWNKRDDNANKVKKVLEEIDSLTMYGVLDNPRFLKEQIIKILDFREAK